MAPRDLPLRELSDRLQINDLLVRYTVAIDTKDYALLDTVFTPDAHCDYTSAGGVKGPYPEVRAWLEKALAPFPMTQHLISNSVVELDGDTATARTMVINPMGLPKPDGGLGVFWVGAWYNDRLAWTEDGWKIRARVEETAFIDGMPGELQIPS